MKLVKPVNWISETEFQIDGLRFHGDLATYSGVTTKSDVFILKESKLLKQYLEFLAPHSIENVVEIGIWQGGSPLFFGLATDVVKIVALDWIKPASRATVSDIELNFVENPAIRHLIRELRLKDKIRLYFDVAQDDRKSIDYVVDYEFQGQHLDLVIDDASHEYIKSKASFEILFPRLREGGFYIIEDWQWAHSSDSKYETGAIYGDKPALSNLIFKLLVAYAGHPGLFQNILVRDWFVAIQKGQTPLPEGFALNDLLRTRGRPMPLI